MSQTATIVSVGVVVDVQERYARWNSREITRFTQSFINSARNDPA
jgi:hypothetical protein